MYRNLGILGSLWSRSLSTAANSGRAGGLIEMREYVLYPSGIKDFMKFTSDYLELRMQLLPFLGYVSEKYPSILGAFHVALT